MSEKFRGPEMIQINFLFNPAYSGKAKDLIQEYILNECAEVIWGDPQNGWVKVPQPATITFWSHKVALEFIQEFQGAGGYILKDLYFYVRTDEGAHDQEAVTALIRHILEPLQVNFALSAREVHVNTLEDDKLSFVPGMQYSIYILTDHEQRAQIIPEFIRRLDQARVTDTPGRSWGIKSDFFAIFHKYRQSKLKM